MVDKKGFLKNLRKVKESFGLKTQSSQLLPETTLYFI